MISEEQLFKRPVSTGFLLISLADSLLFDTLSSFEINIKITADHCEDDIRLSKQSYMDGTSS